MVIEQRQVVHAQPCPHVIEIHFDGIVSYRDHPENVVGVDVHVVVVDLLGEINRSDRSGIKVQSNKGERALVLVAVHVDKTALTEAHVRLERQNGRGPRDGVRSRAAAADVRQAYESIEVGDL